MLDQLLQPGPHHCRTSRLSETGGTPTGGGLDVGDGLLLQLLRIRFGLVHLALVLIILKWLVGELQVELALRTQAGGVRLGWS